MLKIAAATLLGLVVLVLSPSRARAEAVVESVPVLDATAPVGPNLDATAMPEQAVTLWGKAHRLVWTFDDHPSRWTDDLLDLLLQYKIKGTFFVVAHPLWSFYRAPAYGPSRRHLVQTRRVAARGHLIGGHSMTHKHLCQLSTGTVQRYEFGLSQTILKRVLGVTPRFWRPPHGEICGVVWREVRHLLLELVLWDLADYKITAGRMLLLLRRRVEAGQTRTIILFHPQNNSLLRSFLLLLADAQAAPPLQ